LLRSDAPPAGAYRRNVSPSAAETERRRRANAGAPLAVGWRFARRLWGASPFGRRGAPERPTLTPTQARRIETAAAEDLDWLKNEYGVDFR
jgi:hypothetical protein